MSEPRVSDAWVAEVIEQGSVPEINLVSAVDVCLDLRDARQRIEVLEAAARAATPTDTWMVVRKRETNPVEVWIGSEGEMRALFDNVAANWTETFLVRVYAGPRDMLVDPPADERALAALGDQP